MLQCGPVVLSVQFIHRPPLVCPDASYRTRSKTHSDACPLHWQAAKKRKQSQNEICVTLFETLLYFKWTILHTSTFKWPVSIGDHPWEVIMCVSASFTVGPSRIVLTNAYQI